jgi:hypothetical protein
MFQPLVARLVAFSSWHNAQLRSRPYQTNAIQSTTLMIVGDLSAQALERRSRPPSSSDTIDFQRTAILSSWSACVSAPFWTAFYSFLFTRFPNRVLLWVASSAALSPFWNAAFFTYSTSLTFVAQEGRGAFTGDGPARLAASVRSKLERQLVATTQRSISLWVR